LSVILFDFELIFFTSSILHFLFLFSLAIYYMLHPERPWRAEMSLANHKSFSQSFRMSLF
jgi:hypothetical protein